MYFSFQDMAEKPEKFQITFNDTKKVIYVNEFEELYDLVKDKFKDEPNFLVHQFKILYEDKDLDEYVDLDAPPQLVDRKSNKLIVKREQSSSLPQSTCSRYLNICGTLFECLNICGAAASI